MIKANRDLETSAIFWVGRSVPLLRRWRGAPGPSGSRLGRPRRGGAGTLLPTRVAVGWRKLPIRLICCGAILLALTLPTYAQRSAPVVDSAWTARLAALDEERNAQTGVAVSIVFDDSGSMNDNRKLTMAKQAFHAWLERAPENDRFGLTALNAGPLVKLARNNKAQILAAVDHLQAGGGTPLADTVAAVGKNIHQRRAAGDTPYERQVMVILTDGEDTSERGVRGVQEEIRRLRADGVEVIAFGYQGEGDYMRGSATHFFSPENGEDIARGLNVIGSEIGDTSDVAVDAATRAAMGNVAPPAPGKSVLPAEPAPSAKARSFSPYTTPSPTPVHTVPSHKTGYPHGLNGKQFAFIVVACLALRLFFRRRRR